MKVMHHPLEDLFMSEEKVIIRESDNTIVPSY